MLYIKDAQEAITDTDWPAQLGYRYQGSKVIFFSPATTSDGIAESSLALHNDLDTDVLAIHACRCFGHQ